MNEIICPHCKKAFKVDEAGFADILKQVRDHEFEKELHDRVELFERDKQNAIMLAEANTKNELQAGITKKETELAELKMKRDAEVAALKAEKEAQIAKLTAERESVTATLRSQLEATATERRLAVNEAVYKVEKERDELASELRSKNTEKQLLESSLKERFASELRTKDEMIAYYKDMKAKLSTKMVGETLEQHCEIEFEKLRATGFKNAEFGKDNDASSGSKGDYIYREYDENGNELISIMFEMKNEGD